MRFFRSERVQELIRRELGEIIAREADLPANALVTITAVEVDRKLAHAEVRVSVIPSSTGAAALAALARRAAALQRLLTKKINIKPMPRISFALDHGPENAANIEKILLRK